MTITNVTDKEIALAAEIGSITSANMRLQAENAGLQHVNDALVARLRTLEARKDAAYLERNQLVALLSKLFPAGKRKTAIEGWSEDWHGCVYIDLPTGQASWHYHDSQAHLFDHLPEYQGAYDGHTTEQKYQRIAGYVEPKPKAWAIFTGDGNARMWSTYRPHVQKLAIAEGLKITALYAEMPAPAAATSVNCDECVHCIKELDQHPCDACIHGRDFLSKFEPRFRAPGAKS